MSSFTSAFKRTTINEGGYSKHPTDPGGETYRGISRKFFPQWGGWTMVDDAKPMHGDPFLSFKNPDDMARMDELVADFYEKHFWKPLLAQAIDSQDLANKLFDQAVNIGMRAPVSYLQMHLNSLNVNGQLWPDISEDGKVGPITIAASNMCEKHKRTPLLLALIMASQLLHYAEIMSRNPNLEVFAKGWVRRGLSGIDVLLKMDLD